MSGRSVGLLIGAVAAIGVIAGIGSSWSGFAAVWGDIVRAAWILPGLVALHLGQLFLAGLSWRVLFTGQAPGVGTFYRLRIVREGIDALLPVAHVGGEIVGASLLVQPGLTPARACGSIVVDLTLELLTQLAFLLTGVGLLAALFAGSMWRSWFTVGLGGAAVAAGLLLLQRFGALRLLEGLLRSIARRWPALAGASLDGIHAEALGFYRERGALSRSAVVHYIAWALGSVETWAILQIIGVPVSPAEAFIVESLGMAARSAGFVIPAALGAQEGGFVLAGAAVGVAAAPALSLSLIKRLREIVVGSVGLILWRLAVRTPAPAAR